MSKLGLAFQHANGGVQPAKTYHAGDWVRRVTDLRLVIRHVPGLLSDHSKFMQMLTFTDDGYIIVVARAIDGRGDDYTSAWLYVPATAQITGDELNALMAKLKDFLTEGRRPTDAEVEIYFSKDYTDVPAPRVTLPANAQKIYAKRQVPVPFSLSEILDYPFQPYYFKYDGIFLEPEGLPVKDADDLTMSDIEKLVVYVPPTPEEVTALYGPDVKLFDANQEPLTKPIRVPKGMPMRIYIRRKGFTDLVWTVTPTANGKATELPKTLIWQKNIQRSMFKVLGLDGTKKIEIPSARITVDGQPLPHLVSEDQLQSVKVTVTAADFKPKELRMDLAVEPPFNIQLDRSEVKFHIKTKKGQLVEISLPAGESEPDESPLRGYWLKGHTLHYEGTKMGRQRIYGFIAGVLITALAWLVWSFIIASCDDDRQSEIINQNPAVENLQDFDDQAAQPLPDEQPVDSTTQKQINDAVAYLDNNKIWDREKMHGNPVLAGLFEALNTYNFETIKGMAKTLQGSSRFAELLDNVNRNAGHTYGSRYTSDKDHEINIERYIQKLNRGADPKQKVDGAGQPDIQ